MCDLHREIGKDEFSSFCEGRKMIRQDTSKLTSRSGRNLRPHNEQGMVVGAEW